MMRPDAGVVLRSAQPIATTAEVPSAKRASAGVLTAIRVVSMKSLGFKGSTVLIIRCSAGSTNGVPLAVIVEYRCAAER